MKEKQTKALSLCSGIALAVALATSSGNAQITSGTNVGGWNVALSLSKTDFRFDETIVASMTLSNGTSQIVRYGAIYCYAHGESPGFGRLLVVDEEAGKTNEYKMIFPKTKNGITIPMRIGLAYGSLHAHEQETFTFNISANWCVTNAGRYNAYYTGALPSLTEPGKTNAFQTAPLHFRIRGKNRE